MIEQYKNRIETIKKTITNAKEEKIRLETNLEQLQKGKDDLVLKMNTLGYTPDTIQDAIEEKTKTLESVLAKLEDEVRKFSTSAKDVLF